MQTLETTPYGCFCEKCDYALDWEVAVKGKATYAVARCCNHTYFFVNRDGTQRVEHVVVFPKRNISVVLFSIAAFGLLLSIPFLLLTGRIDD